MSNEEFDLNDILSSNNDDNNIDNNNIDNKKKINKKNDKIVENDEDAFNNKLKNILLKSVLPAFLTAILTILFLAFTIGLGGSKENTENTNSIDLSNVPVVEQINDKVSLDEDIKLLQNAQADALQVQIQKLNEKIENDQNGKIKNNTKSITKMNDLAVSTLNPFFEEILKINKDIKENEKLIIKRNLAKSINLDSLSDEDLKKSALLNNIINQKSPAKDLNQNGVKAGTVFVALLGVKEDDTNILLVTVPFTSENKTVITQYIVNMQDSNIQSVDYIGYFNNKEQVEVKTFYEKMKKNLGDLKEASKSSN